MTRPRRPSDEYGYEPYTDAGRTRPLTRVVQQEEPERAGPVSLRAERPARLPSRAMAGQPVRGRRPRR